MIQKDNKLRVLHLFFEKPTHGFSLREIERVGKLGLPSVRRYMDELYHSDFVVRKKVHHMTLWYAHRENQRFKRYLRFYNIEKLYESGLIDYINKELSYPTIILFGSCAKGENIETSDIDIYVQSPEKKLDVSFYEKKLGTIQVFVHRTLRDIKNKNLVNNIINGIALEGFLEVV